ncbi:MAG: T9SS type A sorting domain-containing protein [Flavobacteriales bacterium]
MLRSLCFFILCSSLSVYGQNALLTNPITGAIPSSVAFDDIEVVTEGNSAILFCTSSQENAFYAIHLDDNNASELGSNIISNVADFENKLNDAAGQSNFDLVTMEVNPISKRVYALIENNAEDESYVVVIKNDGANISVMNLENVTYSKMKWPVGKNYNHQDMAWGNSKMVVTSGDWSLASHVAIIESPFEHDFTVEYRRTSMFKTNWGGGYKTNAPLERIEYANIDNVDRLLGVTVCAPGFSLPYSNIPGAGTLTVEEQFNVNLNEPLKVVHQKQDNTHYLFDLHKRFGENPHLIRIGQQYIDGTPLTDGKFNNDVEFLRTNSETLASGLMDDEVKIYTNNFSEIAYWDDCHLLVVEDNVLKLFETGSSASCDPLSVNESNNNPLFELYPNPVLDVLYISLEINENDHNKYEIVSTEGKIINRGKYLKSSGIDVSKLESGSYILRFSQNNKTMLTSKFVKQ